MAPGETDMGERVTGESQGAQHQEIADRARDQGDHEASREGGPHEIVVKHGWP